MIKLLCFLFVVCMPATFINGVLIRLRAPICDDPVLNRQTRMFIMKCRAEGVTNDPRPSCKLKYQGAGAPVLYRVDYRFTPASDLFTMYCDISIKADDFTCGVPYRFAVAATLYGGSFSAGGSKYSSPVTYGPPCPQG